MLAVLVTSPTSPLCDPFCRSSKRPPSHLKMSVSYLWRQHATVPKGGKLSTLEEINDPLFTRMDQQLVWFQLYGRSKLANVMTANYLNRRFNSQGIPNVPLSVDPGSVATDSVLDFAPGTPILGGLLKSAMKVFLTTPAQGAHTSLFAATSPKVLEDLKKYGGAYMEPVGNVKALRDEARDEKLTEHLWSLSGTIMDDILSKK
ncbi:hypothetical protein BKA62DRAFT_703938 [Auriculariales sp. MPI-PUGE-AT-0066]|nr:hypothetical protein BKA62DRAFT_703938 [Auriculariales sp. MPI-PUGE-AT-0066]